MNVYLISDTHFNHTNMETYCDRPSNFTELLIKNWHATVKPEETTWEALKMRNLNDSYTSGVHEADLQLHKVVSEHI